MLVETPEQGRKKVKHSAADVLALERSVNELYLRLLKDRWQQDFRDQTAMTARARNQVWTGSGPRPVGLGREPQALIGRVALDHPDVDLGVSFYVGPAHLPIGEASVAISWAARKASLFYKGRAADDELAKNVV